MNLEWWQKLSAQEQKTLKIGGVLAVILLFYNLIWAPLSDAIDTLRIKVSTQQTQVKLLKTAQREIRQLRKNVTKPRTSAQGSLLTTIDTSLKAAQLDSSSNNFKQINNNQVQISFNNIPFDRLISWIERLWKDYGILVQQMQVTSTSTPGIVQVNLVLA